MSGSAEGDRPARSPTGPPAEEHRPRQPVPWHPIAFAAAYVLNAYVATSISPYAMLRGLFVAIAIATLTMAVAWLAFRSARAGAIVATAVVAFMVFGRELVEAFANATALLAPWQTLVLVIGIGAVLALAVRLALRSLRRPDGLSRWTRSLNALALILLLVIGVTAAVKGTPGEAIADLWQGVPLWEAPDRSDEPREGPDIYLILLDGHARQDVLADRYGYDDGPFLDALADRGFEIAHASHSNYLFTQLTLTSMFQMALLDDVPELGPVIAGVAGNATARQVLNQNPTFAFLRLHGYTTVSFSTPYEYVTVRQADVFIDGPQLTEFEWQLVASTFAPDVIERVAPTFFPDAQRARITGAFENVVAAARDRTLGPRFVFAHVLAPHTPLVFGPHGEPLDVPVLRRTEDTPAGLGLTEAEFIKRSAGQTAYVDDRAIEAIDAILAASRQPPVIIVMSDHGPRSRPIDPATATKEVLRERFGTLFAAYTPGRPGIFPQDTTPAEVIVNLLNAYFGAQLPQPASGTYVSEGSHAFQVTRVPDPPTPD
jgi:hypothetical protein